VKESERRRRLARENGEEREELRRAVVGQVRQREAFGVVLMYSESRLVLYLKLAATTASPVHVKRVRTGTA
jgi:hypothetical protein